MSIYYSLQFLSKTPIAKFRNFDKITLTVRFLPEISTSCLHLQAKHEQIPHDFRIYIMRMMTFARNMHSIAATGRILMSVG